MHYLGKVPLYSKACTTFCDDQWALFATQGLHLTKWCSLYDFKPLFGMERVKCETKKGGKKQIYFGRVGWGAAYLQRCWCSTNEQTKGLSYQCCGRGQGHKQQVPSNFWRLFSHPVDYTTVHDWTNHLEGWILYHYLCECARTKQHLLNGSNVTWNGTSAMVLAK